jgi:hypothetical protein
MFILAWMFQGGNLTEKPCRFYFPRLLLACVSSLLYLIGMIFTPFSYQIFKCFSSGPTPDVIMFSWFIRLLVAMTIWALPALILSNSAKLLYKYIKRP